jgi:hypothetical protein
MRARFAREPSLADPSASPRALRLHRFLLRIGLAGANLFAWIFVFQYFYFIEANVAHAAAHAALLSALSQILTILFTPYAARLLRGGARRMIFAAVLALCGAFGILGAAFGGLWGGELVPEAIVLFAILLGIYRALYWVPYEVEATAERARAGVSVFAECVIALAPLAAGLFIAATHAPMSVLFIAAGAVALSAIPLLYLRDLYEEFSWGYRETFDRLFYAANRTIVLRAFFEGISGAALLFFWPLAVFLIVGSSYGMLGIVLSVTFLVAMCVRAFVRAAVRRARLHDSVLLNVVLAVSPWILRLLVATPLGIVSVDSYFYTTTPRRFGVDAPAFEQTSDGGTFVDEYTALKEIALALGRITACLIGAAFALSASLPVAFIAVFLAAAFASGAAAFLR